jgi:signal transduction histidine kinase
MGIPHDLRYWGSYNAARSRYARIAIASSMTSSNALANLGMEYERVGLLRTALTYTLQADSLFRAESSLRGVIWTQRILYSIYMKLRLRKEALHSLTEYRNAHTQYSSLSATKQMADTVTDVNLIHSIKQFDTWNEDMRLVYGADSQKYIDMYDHVIKSTRGTWKNSWFSKNAILAAIPKPVIRRFPADGTLLAWTDSIVPSRDGELAYATRFGTYVLRGDQWLLQEPLYMEEQSNSIGEASLAAIDTVFTSRNQIRCALPLDDNSIITFTRDSIVRINSGRQMSSVLPRSLRGTDNHIDVLSVDESTFLVLHESILYSYDSNTLKLSGTTALTQIGTRQIPIGRSNRSVALLPLDERFILVKRRDAPSLACVVYNPANRVCYPANVLQTSASYTKSFLAAYQDGNIFARSWTSNGRDTVFVSAQTAVSHGSSSTREEDVFPVQIGSSRPFIALRHLDNLDVIDTSQHHGWPQFAVSIPFDRSSDRAISVFRKHGILSCIYTDGHAVVTIPLHQQSYSFKPNLYIKPSHDSYDQAPWKLSHDASYQCDPDVQYTICIASNLVTSGFPLYYREAAQLGDDWFPSNRKFFWYSQITPSSAASGYFISAPLQASQYFVPVDTSLVRKSLFTSLLYGTCAIATIVMSVQVVRRRRKQQQDSIDTAKAQQLELLREDMHDMIGSRLVRIASLARQASPENHDEVLARIHDMTIVTVRSLRNLLTLMSDSSMTDLDFYSSMREYVSESCKDARIECSIDVNVNETSSHDNASRHELLMIISEMLTNTIRHASASHVAFSIRSDDAQTIITWSDNGTGFDSSAKRGNGLHNIERRAKRIKAVVVSESAPEHGTRYSITFPASQRAQS